MTTLFLWQLFAQKIFIISVTTYSTTYRVWHSELQHLESGHSCVFQDLHEDSQPVWIQAQYNEDHPRESIQFHWLTCKQQQHLHTPETITHKLLLLHSSITYYSWNLMMKVLCVDNCSQETYLADVLMKCSNPPQGETKKVIFPTFQLDAQ